MNESHPAGPRISRRRFLIGGTAAAMVGGYAGLRLNAHRRRHPVAILKVRDYQDRLRENLLAGLAALGFAPRDLAGRRVVLKPNLVEPRRDVSHINTNPLVVQAAIEVFLQWGAESVVVAEGAGHMRDAHRVVEESGLADVLVEDGTPFVDLNFAPTTVVPNAGGVSTLPDLVIPRIVNQSDFFVSMAKMKLHHWAGVTLSMKNLFGIMPGAFYGWPKNLLHLSGLERSILDISASVRTHLAIVDGIVGMEGDGPIVGPPVKAGVLVMGRNPTAVDATCARVMGLSPERVRYLRAADGWLGDIGAGQIDQRGEPVGAVRTPFQLLPDLIPAHARLVEPGSPQGFGTLNQSGS